MKSKQEILEKAIARAEAGGFDFLKWFNNVMWDIHVDEQYRSCKIAGCIDDLLCNDRDYKLLLTDHAFCKALWGEGEIVRYDLEGNGKLEERTVKKKQKQPKVTQTGFILLMATLVVILIGNYTFNKWSSARTGWGMCGRR